MDDSPALPIGPPKEAGETGGFEQRLWVAAIEGRVARPQNLTASFDDRDNWVRSDFVRFLLAIEKDPTHKIHERGVRLQRLRIIGKLDPSNCEVRRPLRFEDCMLDEIDPTSAKVAALRFAGSSVGDAAGHARSPHDDALNLSPARSGGTRRLGDRFRTDRGVLLNDLRVSGILTLRGARLATAGAPAIVTERTQVDGTFDLDSTTCLGAAAVAAADAGGKSAAGRLAPKGRRGLDLTAAQVGSLSDQWADWPRGNRVLGFRYQAIVGATSTRAEWWVHWLKLQVDEDLCKVRPAEEARGVDGFKPRP